MYRYIALAAGPAAMAQTYYGCYTEGSSSRALTGAATTNYTTMSIAECEGFCTTAPNAYSIWGVEYGGECYCGDALTQGSFPTFSTDCAVPCPGDIEVMCGGGNRLSLYGTAAEAPAVIPNPTVGAVTEYEPVGCYTEGVGVRALGGATAFSATDMTTENCATFCLNAGYLLFGTEYMAECFCGSEIAPSANATVATECFMPCSGNAGEVCGGPDRVSVWQWIDEDAEPVPEPTPEPTEEPTPEPTVEEPTPEPTPESSSAAEPAPEPTPAPEERRRFRRF